MAAGEQGAGEVSFGITQHALVVGLEAVANGCCAYRLPTEAGQHRGCDCKYGAATGLRRGEFGNGCPETRLAAELIGAMTPAEYARVCKRAKVLL